MEDLQVLNEENYNVYFCRGHPEPGGDKYPRGNDIYRQLIRQHSANYTNVNLNKEGRHEKTRIVKDLINAMVTIGSKFFHLVPADDFNGDGSPGDEEDRNKRPRFNKVLLVGGEQGEEQGEQEEQGVPPLPKEDDDSASSRGEQYSSSFPHKGGMIWKQIDPNDRFLQIKVRQSLRDTHKKIGGHGPKALRPLLSSSCATTLNNNHGSYPGYDDYSSISCSSPHRLLLPLGYSSCSFVKRMNSITELQAGLEDSSNNFQNYEDDINNQENQRSNVINLHEDPRTLLTHYDHGSISGPCNAPPPHDHSSSWSSSTAHGDNNHFDEGEEYQAVSSRRSGDKIPCENGDHPRLVMRNDTNWTSYHQHHPLMNNDYLTSSYQQHQEEQEMTFEGNQNYLVPSSRQSNNHVNGNSSVYHGPCSQTIHSGSEPPVPPPSMIMHSNQIPPQNSYFLSAPNHNVEKTLPPPRGGSSKSVPPTSSASQEGEPQGEYQANYNLDDDFFPITYDHGYYHGGGCDKRSEEQEYTKLLERIFCESSQRRTPLLEQDHYENHHNDNCAITISSHQSTSSSLFSCSSMPPCHYSEEATTTNEEPINYGASKEEAAVPQVGNFFEW